MTIPEFFTPAWCPPWTAALINHLWQSTTIVLVAWLLTLLLRTNPARVRYAIWMTASIKFLVPFTFLSSLGAHWAIPNPSPQAGPSIYAIVEDFGQPFHRANAPGPLAPIVSSPSHSIQLTSSLFAAVWLCGFSECWLYGLHAGGEPQKSRDVPSLLPAAANLMRFASSRKTWGLRSHFFWFVHLAQLSLEFLAWHILCSYGRSASQNTSMMPRSRRSWLMRLSTSAGAIT